MTKLPELRPGSVVAQRWQSARVGMTLSQLLALGVTHGDVRAFMSNGRLAFDGPLPQAKPRSGATRRVRPPPKFGQERRCLRCTRQFISEGPHNRLCDPCREAVGMNA